MAEEAKKEEQKTDGKKGVATLFKFVLGIALLVLAGYLLFVRGWWGYYTWPLIKGSAAPFLVLAGIITLAIAKE